MKFTRKLLLAALFSLVVILIWYNQLIKSVSRPYLIRNGVVKVAESQNVPDQTLIYPNLGIIAPVSASNQYSPFSLRDWNSISSLLEKGVGVFYNGNTIDESTYVYAVGHSTASKPQAFASIFASLNSAQTNDEVILKIAGQEYVYKVTDKKILSPYDTNGFSEFFSDSKDQNNHRIALVTCWPLFTTKNRVVVIADRLN